MKVPLWNERALPDVRIAQVCVVALTLGLAASLGGNAGWRDLGSVLGCLGGGGLAWWLWQAGRAWRAAQATQAARARRAALRAARRQRDQQERVRRQAQRTAHANATARLAEKRAAQHHAEQRAAHAEATRRAERESEIAAEVARLHALTDAQLAAEVAALLTRRGLRPQPQLAEAECDLTLLTPEGRLEVARCVPVGRVAGKVDVQALEAWRQAAGADHAYLIALAGFAPTAVERVRDLPITLVEAHLLAHWQLSPGMLKKEGKDA